MTVSTDTRRVQYATNGTTGPFTVTFPFLENSHLAVTHTDSTGVDTNLTLNVDYTVSSGQVTTTVAYASGGVITIDRDIPITQELDLRDGDDFPAESMERALDLLTMIAQQVAIDAVRVLRVPEVAANIPFLPALSDRANRLLAFDGNGDPTVVVPVSGTAADVLIQLANSASAAQGPALLAYNPALTYASGIGEFLNRIYARTAGEVSAGVTPTNYHFPPGDVRRYGADPTGVSNSLTAWQAAFASSKEVYAPSGTYEFGTVSGGTTMIDLSTRGNDITLRTGRGVKLRCTTTSDIPYFFRLDNNSRCTFGDIEFEDLGGDNTVTWKGAFGFYLTNNTPTNWGNLKFGTITCTKLVAPITAQATGSATNRIRDIVIDQINLTDCYYGLLLQNDGDSVKVDQITANSCVRPFFVYGVSGVEAKVFGRNNLGTSGAVHISRQTGGLNTSNIRVSYVGRNAALNATHVLLSHTDISGGEINGVDLTIDLEGSVSYNSVRFVTYNAGAEYAPATNNIINNVRIWARCGANAASVSTPSAFNTKGRLWFYADGGLGLTQSTIDQFRIGNAANGNTPTWATSGTQPAIVNGSLTSNYAIADGVCTENIRMQAGSSTTFGTGAWTFSTAFTATQTATGSVYLRDATGSHWVGVARLVTGTNVVALYSTNGNGVDATNPFTWASTDYLEITISYRFAQ